MDWVYEEGVPLSGDAYVWHENKLSGHPHNPAPPRIPRKPVYIFETPKSAAWTVHEAVLDYCSDHIT